MKTLTINMKANDTAEVLIYDPIGFSFFEDGITAKQLREQIKGIKAQTLNLRINSPGGNVFEASAMLSALDDFKASKGDKGARTIEVDVDGLAASAASVVAMAGDTIRIASNGLLMIHNPMSGVLGGAEAMRREADLLDKVKDQIIDAYRRKSKAERAAIAAWMDAETWFTGAEAVEAGLADSVTSPVQVAAMARFVPIMNKFHFQHAPDMQEALAIAQEETRKRKELVESL